MCLFGKTRHKLVICEALVTSRCLQRSLSQWCSLNGRWIYKYRLRERKISSCWLFSCNGTVCDVTDRVYVGTNRLQVKKTPFPPVLIRLVSRDSSLLLKKRHHYQQRAAGTVPILNFTILLHQKHPLRTLLWFSYQVGHIFSNPMNILRRWILSCST